MKHNYSESIKIKMTFLAVLLLLLLSIIAQAQNITVSIENATTTNDGSDDFYEADIYISSTTDFYLSSGQVYIDYSEAAFGPNVVTNGNVEYSQPSNSILGFAWAGVPFPTPAYKSFIINDNISSRYSPSFQQNIALSGLEFQPAELQITVTPKVLFHIKMKYLDSSQDPSICFKSDGVFQDQFFTACGGASTADCAGSPGTQIMNDTYVCTNAVLAVEDIKLNTFDIQVYPNPAADIIYINSTIDINKIELFDLLGKQVISTNQTSEINISHLPVGVYLVKAFSENGSITKKIIIE